MSIAVGVAAVSVARAYFALQAVAGAVWWVAVFASEDVRSWTLGTWDPALLVGPDLVLFVGASAVVALVGSRIAAATAAVWTTGVAIVLGLYGLTAQAAGWGVILMTVAAVGTVASAATVWFGHLPTRWFFVGPFSFRVAGEASGGRHLRRSLTQLVVFWTTFFVIVPVVLTMVEARLQLTWSALDAGQLRTIGVAAFLAGSALGLSSCVTMALRGNGTPLPAETARELVVAGPYRWVRNPMAVAGLVQTAAIGLVAGSWMVIVIAVAGAVAWDVLIRPAEEADLAARFGEPYRRYARRVRCWIPRRPGEVHDAPSVGGVG
ncbi:MAG: methyltransferase family protein [Acidimicrobiales bacterium]